MTDADILSRAIVPFLLWDNSIPTEEDSLPCVGKGGTCFFIQHKDDFYAVTARHCLEPASPKHIFIALPNKSMKGLPVSKVLVSHYEDSLGTDTDIILIKLSILDLLVAKAKSGSDKLAADILNTPYMKREMRLNKHRKPIDRLKKTVWSSFYETIRNSKQKEILELVEKVYTDDLTIRILKLNEVHDMKVGDTCVALGFPNSNFHINYSQRTINSLILGVKCEFIGFDANRHDYVFKCEEVDLLNGMSGGPVLFQDRVIGVLHSANVKENKVYATPINPQFIEQASQV